VGRQAPGRIRDSIMGYLAERGSGASVKEVHTAVERHVGRVAPSSVRSYLNLNTPEMFERIGRGQYKIRGVGEREAADGSFEHSEWPQYQFGNATLHQADCLDWMARSEAHVFHAVVMDPPYGLVEYSEKEQQKLRAGRGGVWRIPPSFDGNVRAPLPRFTILGELEKQNLRDFFIRIGVQLMRVTVPGANVVIASNPLLMHLVAGAMVECGFENRGSVVRLVMTMRGGDRPKNAHLEFDGVSVMPRSMWEPWLVFRHPLIGRVQDNLRKWQTGGFRRPSKERPFGDVIRSSPTAKKERQLAPHPSLKPQRFLREIVRAALPLGKGIILDPFAGSGSTLAAAEAIGYRSVGIEIDPRYVAIAAKAIPKLKALVG
jgi:DNA modification methylase